MHNVDDLYDTWKANPIDDTLIDLLACIRSLAARSHPEFGDDIAQEVLMVVWQKLASFEPDGKPNSMERWVNAIIRRTRANAMKEKFQHISSSNLIEVAIGEPMDFLDVSAVSAEMQTIASLMLAGYNFREIAEKLDIKGGTLRKRLHAYRHR